MKDDGTITDEEQAFLDRLARNLDISEADYKQILKHYKSHPINPPTMYNARLERLYDLSRMVVLRKIAIGLGFTPENVKYVVDKALTLVSNGVDVDTFVDEIKNMNR